MPFSSYLESQLGAYVISGIVVGVCSFLVPIIFLESTVFSMSDSASPKSVRLLKYNQPRITALAVSITFFCPSFIIGLDRGYLRNYLANKLAHNILIY